jgi:hypothetical protein
MLKIAKSNSKTRNNSKRLVIAALIINIAKLVAITLAIPVIATPLKLATIAPFKHSAYKVIRGRAASNTS